MEDWLVLIDYAGTLDNMPEDQLADFIRQIQMEGFRTNIISAGNSVGMRQMIEITLGQSGLHRPEWPPIRLGAARDTPEAWIWLAEFTHPSRCIIIDNDVDNVATARQAGMAAIHFQNAYGRNISYTINSNPHSERMVSGPLESLLHEICMLRRHDTQRPAPTKTIQPG